MKTHYIKPATIKKFVKAHGKRTGTDFLEALDRYIEKKLLTAVAEHNGGKKTLDAGVAAYIFGNK